MDITFQNTHHLLECYASEISRFGKEPVCIENLSSNNNAKWLLEKMGFIVVTKEEEIHHMDPMYRVFRDKNITLFVKFDSEWKIPELSSFYENAVRVFSQYFIDYEKTIIPEQNTLSTIIYIMEYIFSQELKSDHFLYKPYQFINDFIKNLICIFCFSGNASKAMQLIFNSVPGIIYINYSTYNIIKQRIETCEIIIRSKIDDIVRNQKSTQNAEYIANEVARIYSNEILEIIQRYSLEFTEFNVTEVEKRIYEAV